MSCKVLALVVLTLLAVVSGAHGIFVSTGAGFGPGFGFPFGPSFPFGNVFGFGGPFGGPFGFVGRHMAFGFGPGGFFTTGFPGEVKTIHTKPGETVFIPSKDGRGGMMFSSSGGPWGGFTSMFTSTSF